MSTPDKLVFYTSFHHMNDNGFYDGWTEHTVTVRPSLQFGFNMKISGQNRNEIKYHLHDVFYTTSGVDTPVATAAKFGQEIAAELREAKVGAVILTGT